MGRIGGSKALLVGRLRANYRYHNFVIPTDGCPYTLDFLPPSESVSSERYPRQYFEGFNNPSPRPIAFLVSVTTDPLRGHSHQAQHTSLALQLNHHSANTGAQQLRVLHNDQLTIGGNTGRLQDANAETLRGMSDEPGCS